MPIINYTEDNDILSLRSAPFLFSISLVILDTFHLILGMVLLPLTVILFYIFTE